MTAMLELHQVTADRVRYVFDDSITAVHDRHVEFEHGPAAEYDLVIGADAQNPAFFWLAAQGGYGIQSADGVSRLAQSRLLGQPLPESLRQEGVDPQRLSPARLR